MSPARSRRRTARLLLQGVDVIRLRDRNELDGYERADDLGGTPPVGNAEAHHGRAGDGEVFRGDQRQPETADRGLQPLHRIIAGDLQHHLILDEAGLGGRRNVNDPPVEAGRQLLLARGRVEGCCCGGSRMPSWRLLTTGAVLRAASWTVLPRF